MEDVQDGRKISIQDGVEEDPELEEHFLHEGKSTLSLAYEVAHMPNPKIESVIELSTESTKLTGSIATIIELSVI